MARFSTLFFLFYLICVFQDAKAQNIVFDAKGLLILNDADMVASTITDGYLARTDGISDSLTRIRIQGKEVKSLALPNSVTNWHQGMVLSSDRKVVFSVDTRLSPANDVEKVADIYKDLPNGSMLYATSVRTMRVIDSIKIGALPHSVDISPNGRWLVVPNSELRSEIAIIAWNGNKFGQIYDFPKGDITRSRITDIRFHPKGKLLVATLEGEKDAIQFYDFLTDGDKPEVVLSAEITEKKLLPRAGQFTPDGKLFIVPAMHVTDAGNGDPFRPFELLVISLSTETPEIIQKTELGFSSECFTITSDGKYMLAVNTNATFLPLDSPNFTGVSTLLLFEIKEGKLKKIDKLNFSALLPTSICFDKTNKHFAVSCFGYPTSPTLGGIEFFYLIDGRISSQNSRLFVTRGAHKILWW